MITTSQPCQCSLCGGYLTTAREYALSRCHHPGHWLAAGLLEANDFYAMAVVVASGRNEYSYSAQKTQAKSQAG